MSPKAKQPHGPSPSSEETSHGSSEQAEPLAQKLLQHEVLKPRKRRVYRMPLAMRHRRDRFRHLRNDVILWLVAIGVSLWAIWMWLSILDPTNQVVKTAIQEGELYLKRAREAWSDLSHHASSP
jgi:hypothetical protein